MLHVLPFQKSPPSRDAVQSPLHRNKLHSGALLGLDLLLQLLRGEASTGAGAHCGGRAKKHVRGTAPSEHHVHGSAVECKEVFQLVIADVRRRTAGDVYVAGGENRFSLLGSRGSRGRWGNFVATAVPTTRFRDRERERTTAELRFQFALTVSVPSRWFGNGVRCLVAGRGGRVEFQRLLAKLRGLGTGLGTGLGCGFGRGPGWCHSARMRCG